MGAWDGLAGGAGLIGAVLGGVMQNNANVKQAEAANAFSAKQAEAARIYNTQAWEASADHNWDAMLHQNEYNWDAMLHGNEYNWNAMKHQNAFNRESQQLQNNYNWAGMLHQNQYNTAMMDRAQGYNTGMVARQEDFQRETLATARDYNTRMANTAYQRGMADMRAAGLNPILAYAQGGATSPTTAGASGGLGSSPMASGSAASGGMASGSSAHSGSASGSRSSVGSANPSPSPHGIAARIENLIGPAMGSALQAGRTLAEIDNIKAATERTDQDTRVGVADERVRRAQERNIQVNTAKQIQETVSETHRPDLLRANIRSEESRPALLGAQAAHASASARSTEQEVRRFHHYGPRGTIPDAAASGEAMGRRAGPHVSGWLDQATTRADGSRTGLGAAIDRLRSLFQ